jgi:hypothetical protein
MIFEDHVLIRRAATNPNETPEEWFLRKQDMVCVENEK